MAQRQWTANAQAGRHFHGGFARPSEPFSSYSDFARWPW